MKPPCTAVTPYPAITVMAPVCCHLDHNPWTLPANQAVALNPELDYAVVQAGERRFLVAEG